MTTTRRTPSPLDPAVSMANPHTGVVARGALVDVRGAGVVVHLDHDYETDPAAVVFASLVALADAYADLLMEAGSPGPRALLAAISLGDAAEHFDA